MGIITIKTEGSFGYNNESFSAIKYGHAHAIAEAIKYLAETLLPWAISADHELHDEGKKPEEGFRKLQGE